MLRLGLLSTARINGIIVAAAAATGCFDVSAVASRDVARAEAYARETGISRPYGSYDALLLDPEVDAVYISLPNRLHHEWTMRALDAGKHVLCEKPYSRHPAEVEAAFARAAQHGLILTEGFMYRHHPQTQTIGHIASNGALGRLQAIHADFSLHLKNPSDGRFRADLDRGSLMDIGCYCISVLRLLAGEPERVAGEHVIGPTGVDVAFHGKLRFRDDIAGEIDCSFLLPRRQNLEVIGEDGSLIVQAPFRPDWGGHVVLQRGTGRTCIEIPEANSFERELVNFADAVAGRDAPLLDREDALGQARTIDALHRAAENAQWVDL